MKTIFLRLLLVFGLLIQGQNKSVSEKGSEKIYSLTAVGDIMMGTNFPNSSYLPPNDGQRNFAPVSQI